jgi:hypothetical protein
MESENDFSCRRIDFRNGDFLLKTLPERSPEKRKRPQQFSAAAALSYFYEGGRGAARLA